MSQAIRVAVRYRRAMDEWQKSWGWPDVHGYTVSKGHSVGTAIYKHTEGGFEVIFDTGGSTFKSDLAVRSNRGRWRTRAEIPVILEKLAEAWRDKQAKAPKNPGSVRLTADELSALSAIVNDGDRDGDLFSRSTTLEVATYTKWDTAKAYRVLNGLARKGVVVKSGKVPVNPEDPRGYQGEKGKTIGWQLWHVNFDDLEGKFPGLLAQAGFKSWDSL